MRIALTSVSVDDQTKALAFYTEKLGFISSRDIPMGASARWLTVVSADNPDGPELLLEPNADYAAMKALKDSLVRDGIPFTAFEVDDLQAEHARLESLGVKFTTGPTESDEARISVFDDTCGNLIQIYEVKSS